AAPHATPACFGILPMPSCDDPTLRNARREGLVIFAAWAAATTYCCVASYLFGYSRPNHPLGQADLDLVFGIPSRFARGVLAPWAVSFAFTFWSVGTRMAEDDLGKDHAQELEEDIRGEASDG